MPNTLLRNRQLGSDVARVNLLVNGGFEWWQRGNGPFSGYCADRWALYPSNGGTGGTTISCSRDTANAEIAGACAAITPGGPSPSPAQPAQIYQYAAHQNDAAGLWGQVYGRPLSLALRVKTSVASAARAAMQIASNAYYGSYHTGNGQYQTLTVSVTAAQTSGLTAVGPTVALNMDALGTFYLDSAMLVIGSQPCDYVPMHPADDLARCLRYYRRWNFTSAADAPLLAHANTTGSALVPLPSTAPMAVSPSLTTSALANLSLIFNSYGGWSSPTAISIHNYEPGMGTVVLYATGASGLIAGGLSGLGSSGGNGWIALEANP